MQLTATLGAVGFLGPHLRHCIGQSLRPFSLLSPVQESFNSANHIPHTLLCGHSLCRKCVQGLPTATLPGVQLLLPYSISCPWCKWLTPRLFWKGVLAYPPKNFSLVRMPPDSDPCFYRPCYRPHSARGSTVYSLHVKLQVSPALLQMWLVETLRSPILSPQSPPHPSPIATRPSTRSRVFVTPITTLRQVSPPAASVLQGHQAGFDSHDPWRPEIEEQRWGLRTVEPRSEVQRAERANRLEQETRWWVSMLTSLVAYAAWFEREERSWVSTLSSTALYGVWFVRKLPYIFALLFLIICVAPIPAIILGSFFAVFSTSAIFLLPCSFSIAAIIMFACHLVKEMVRR